MKEELKNTEKKEISLDELSKVTGGTGLKHTIKEKTYDISEDTKKKMN